MKSSKLHIAHLLIAICCISMGYANNSISNNAYIFRQVNSTKGLSDNNIRNLLMLPDGVMTLYSPTMLSLHDGMVFMDYPFNSTFIPYKEYSTNVVMVPLPDNKIIILNGDRTWCFDLNTLRYIYNDDQICAVPLNSIKSIITNENQDTYYIYTKDERLISYNHTTQTTTAIDSPEELRGEIRMTRYENFVYILTKEGSLLKYDTQLGKFTNTLTNLNQDSLTATTRLDIEVTQWGDVWIMFDKYIKCIDSKSFTQTHLFSPSANSSSIFTSIALDPKGKIWVGSSKQSLAIIDSQSGNISTPDIEVIDDELVDYQTGISNIYADSKGGMWIATETNGVLYYHQDMFRLKSISNEHIKCMVCDKNGEILLGTLNGLHSYNPLTDKISTPYKELEGEDCISLYRDSRDRIWLGTFRNGVYCIDNGKIRNYSDPSMPLIETSYQTLTPNYNCVRAMLEDSNGDFWISVYGGLAQFDTQSGDVDLLSKRFPEIAHVMFVRDITQVGNSIFASSNNGYFSYNLLEDSVIDEEITTYPSNSNIYNMCNQSVEDSNGNVWVATSTGIRLIKKSGETQIISISDGLASNNITAIAKDRLSNIWVISPSSASRVTIIEDNDYSQKCTLSITSFTADDGLDVGILSPKSITSDTHGRIYIGGSQGFCIINPSQLYQGRDNNAPIITNLSIFNTPINVGQSYNGRVILEQSISTTEQLTLNHNESFLSFDFSNLNYINPNHTIYRYKLENFDKEWHQLNSSELNRATYTLLQPGKYTLRIIASNNGTDWDKKGVNLQITIKPPFYRTTVAYLIYCIIVLILIQLLRRYINARNLERLEQREQNRREQINQMKFRFFTNMSHELRTPLSLILLPLNNIIRKTPSDAEITPQLLTIERNASQLLSLVNHLLDFRKLEMGGEKLTLTKNNPVVVIETIISNFSSTSDEKNIELTIVDNLYNKMYYFDITHINKVINNLISNALKFTPGGGKITISLKHNSNYDLIIEVSDTGVGISKEDQALIFDRFYQVKDHEAHSTGSGIGLHLAKQYIELHKGTLSVESQEGVGSTFRVEIPDLSADYEEELDAKEEIDNTKEPDNIAPVSIGEQKYKILIVEDNTDFRDYLAMELKALSYEVYTAVDGEDGINKARSILPSLIISDIMMPKCDGFTLCNTIKEDINTSHIPIILLTARTADDVRYEGYKSGANAYISKPFSFDVLEIRISTLIEEHRNRIEKIRSPREINSSQITISPLDEKLMAQIIGNIEKNMNNADYSVEQLSTDVAMHRMNLYRKIQSIAGMSPSEFIRTMRIKRAAQLLEQNSSLSIVEISEMVGFNTPKYFTNYFKQIYGVTPSQYATSLKVNETKDNDK